MKYLIIFLALIATSAQASGLYYETTTPIAGQVITYRRTPVITAQNPLGGIPSVDFVTEQVKLYPDGQTVASFLRRVSLLSTEFEGKKIPFINPIDGAIIGYVTTDQYYAISLSLFILAEKKADKQVGFLTSDPTTICYTTNGADPICQLP